MALANTFFDDYLEQFNVMTISMTLIVMIVWILLFILKLYTVHHILYKNKDLTIRVKVLTILSTISFQSYITSIVISMMFYQCNIMQKYRYSIGMSYILMVIGKLFMYILFLETLIKTFKRSLYQISSNIHKFIMTLIIINFMTYIIISCFWIKYTQHIKPLIFCSVSVEMFYSLFIVALFVLKLFMLNLARIDQHKSAKYENRIRSATLDIVNEHKKKLKLQRSLSAPDVHTTEDNTHHRRNKSVTFSQHKSINIHRFNKENKELLDEHQLSVIDTAAKHTVLSCIAFITSLQSTLLIGTVYYCDFAVLFIVLLNVVIGDLCVLLRFNDVVLMKIYDILCCGFSVCCKHCFLYCSIRHIMTKIEDKLTEKIEKECAVKTIIIESELNVHSVQQHTQNIKNNLTLEPRTLQQLQSHSMSSQLSASNTPIENGNKTPSYFYEQNIDKEDENITSYQTKINITVTSPDNKDIVFISNKCDDKDSCTDSEDMDKDIVFIIPTQSQ